MSEPKIKRKVGRWSVRTIADLRARCDVDASPGGCWVWRGPVSSSGTPQIRGVDPVSQQKRARSGLRVVWELVHDEELPTQNLIYHRCGNSRCLNPIRLGKAFSRREINAHVGRAGFRKGEHSEARLKSLRKAWAVTGQVPTPEHIKAEVLTRLAAGERGRYIARDLGLTEAVVSLIKVRQRKREPLETEAA